MKRLESRNCNDCGQPVPVRTGPATCATCQRQKKTAYHRARREAAKNFCPCGAPKQHDAKMCRECARKRTCATCGTYVPVAGTQCHYCIEGGKRPHNQGGHCPETCSHKGKPHSHCRGDGTRAVCGYVLPLEEKQCDICEAAQKRRELRRAGAALYVIDRHRKHPHLIDTLSIGGVA